MSRRIFETGESGPAKELSEEEKEKNRQRVIDIELLKYLKGTDDLDERRVFETGESGTAKELSEEEKEERLRSRLRAKNAELIEKDDWWKRLIEASGSTLEKCLDECVERDMERIRELEKKLKE